MKIFGIKKTYFRLVVTIFGIKLSFKTYQNPYLNKFVTIGTNCFTRLILTKMGVKPRKKDGELSCPFDLCLAPIASVEQLLKNKFDDFFENIEYDKENLIWKNTKYNIVFPHDYLLENKEEFIKRYQLRYENLKYIMKNTSLPICISVIYLDDFNINVINSIYNFY